MWQLKKHIFEKMSRHTGGVHKIIIKVSPTECIEDLDIQSEKIIFGSILATFESSSIFGGSWGSIENWLEP